MKNHRFAILLLFVFAALLPVLVLRDFTPSNELRYLSIADEALREGHLFTFTNQGAVYADKPPLYLWIVMLGKLLFGRHLMGFLTLFSIVPAFVILRTMDRWTAPLLGEKSRRSAALMLMTSGLFLGLAVFVRMDMLMCMFITLALHAFWRLYTDTGNRWMNRVLFPLYTWLALFTKGPVGLLVPLLSVAVFLAVQGEIRRIGRYCGWLTWGIIAAACTVWFAAVRFEGGPEYLNNLLFHQTIDRAVDAFHHKEPVWYYLLSVWYSLAPWSLLIIGVMAAAAIRRTKLVPLERLFLTVILTTLAMLSVFSSKIAVYLAPTFPFFVYLAALLTARMPAFRWMKASVALPALIWMAAPGILPLLGQQSGFEMAGNGWIRTAAWVLGATGVAAIVRLRSCKRLHDPIGVLAAGTLLAAFVGGFALPELNSELGYGNLCREVVRMTGDAGPTTVYTWKMRHPEAMDVYLGQDIVKVNTEEVLAGRCVDGVLLLPKRKLAKDPEMRNYIAEKTCVTQGKYLFVIMACTNPNARE